MLPIREELQLNDIKINDEGLIEDFETIQSILTNNQIIINQLYKIEIALKEINLDKHLISTVLYQWSQKNEFNEQWAIVSQFLSINKFLSFLKNTNLMKDVGVSPTHGEWSHAIQWFIIAEANKDKSVLKNNPSVIYSKMGNDECKSIKENPINKIIVTAWDLLLDRSPSEIQVNPVDFRYPENIITFIQENSEKFPKFSLLLQKRYEKRMNNISIKNTAQFFNRKKIHENEAALNKLEKIIPILAAGRATMVDENYYQCLPKNNLCKLLYFSKKFDLMIDQVPDYFKKDAEETRNEYLDQIIFDESLLKQYKERNVFFNERIFSDSMYKYIKNKVENTNSITL